VYSCLLLSWVLLYYMMLRSAPLAHLWIKVSDNIACQCCKAGDLAGILLSQLLVQGGLVYLTIVSSNNHTLNTLGELTRTRAQQSM
jgi:hypothetical protein